MSLLNYCDIADIDALQISWWTGAEEDDWTDDVHRDAADADEASKLIGGGQAPAVTWPTRRCQRHSPSTSAHVRRNSNDDQRRRHRGR